VCREASKAAKALDGKAASYEVDTLEEYYGKDPATRNKKAIYFFGHFHEVGDVRNVCQQLAMLPDLEFLRRPKKSRTLPALVSGEAGPVAGVWRRSRLPRSFHWRSFDSS